MKVLIIEDDEGIRATLRDMLELNGHDTLVAANGANGILQAALHPDLIFCDIGLPDMDGYAVLGALRKINTLNETPFVFLTARVSRDDQRRGMGLGADDYITKPFSEQEILEAIEARRQRGKTLRERIDALATRHENEINACWSHELLTPMNGIFGSLELLEEELGALGRKDLLQLLNLIRQSSERQFQLSKKLIRFYNLERGRARNQRPQPDTCDCAQALEKAVERLRLLQPSVMDVPIQCEPARLPLSTEQLADALAEPLENALRFSPRPGTVTIQGGRTGEQRYRFIIEDRGPGMTEDQRKAIGAFVQFERNRRQQPGLGLGLVITRDILGLVGGQLLLEAGDPQGLRVSLELPLVHSRQT